MTSTAPTPAATPTIAVDVRMVGVLGCSASGKSTVAHQLAQHLSSPLHPISTDQFFLDDVCTRLGTYDDYRCLDYATITHWMQTLRQSSLVECGAPSEGTSDAWAAHTRDAWCAQKLAQLPDLAPYLRSPTGLIEPCPTGRRAEAAGNEEAEDLPDDASLCAHEAEDGERRANAVAPTTPGSSSADPIGVSCPPGGPGAAVRNAITVYVVWEGFTLLCGAAVSACVDDVVVVRCEPETACLRRFFRSPRRHVIQHAIQLLREDEADGTGKKRSPHGDGVEETKGEAEERLRANAALAVTRVVRQLYRPRITQMWAARSCEAQRIALRNDLLQEMRRDMQNDGDDGDAAAAVAVEGVERLLAPTVFNPPRPHVPSGMTGATSGERGEESPTCDTDAYWTPEGVPTRAFQRFWEVEFEQWLSHPSSPSDARALSWASVSAAGEEGKMDRSVFVPRGDGADHPTVSAPLTPATDVAADNGLTGKAYVAQVLAERGLQALAREPSQTAPAAAAAAHGATSSSWSPPPSASCVAAALAPFYYEFRYWFFFEVLFYDRLLSPLQMHRVRHRSPCGTAAAASAVRPWWVVDNGHALQGKKEQELLRVVQHVATSMLALRG
ncbi:hypothetical protein ABB37_06654 [Leptomonas pyrrhocoris]|uniref:Uncharacterized protein n=1 Tax=Leptomonas pyrrhocoris TaxID=157538 RepID=A0A0N0VEH3_LEPPY|nr:hypothetical protein ABB37_06654 [Leptomonas pyrrhocoris]KPA77851.1 hypothetical protein ABB37_06654 [Leptomonas pyrrhocoris]|eukprot:XP_015656290.1 hypothetical protein ABB37_06654 [Leptomonas pyrrhocoris]